MTRSTALGMLKVGNTGEEILQILDVIVSDIEQENINDCAEYFASISAWSVLSEWYLEGVPLPPFFVFTVTLNVLKSIKNGIINILSFFM